MLPVIHIPTAELGSGAGSPRAGSGQWPQRASPERDEVAPRGAVCASKYHEQAEKGLAVRPNCHGWQRPPLNPISRSRARLY